jgi:hypothetical protein
MNWACVIGVKPGWGWGGVGWGGEAALFEPRAPGNLPSARGPRPAQRLTAHKAYTAYPSYNSSGAAACGGRRRPLGHAGQQPTCGVGAAWPPVIRDVGLSADACTRDDQSLPAAGRGRGAARRGWARAPPARGAAHMGAARCPAGHVAEEPGARGRLPHQGHMLIPRHMQYCRVPAPTCCWRSCPRAPRAAPEAAVARWARPRRARVAVGAAAAAVAAAAPAARTPRAPRAGCRLPRCARAQCAPLLVAGAAVRARRALRPLRRAQLPRAERHAPAPVCCRRAPSLAPHATSGGAGWIPAWPSLAGFVAPTLGGARVVWVFGSNHFQ